jgi:uncharacterized lipoprotein YehR (DUF1307 family)
MKIKSFLSFLAMLLISVMVLSLAACGSKDAETKNNESGSQVTTKATEKDKVT